MIEFILNIGDYTVTSDAAEEAGLLVQRDMIGGHSEVVLISDEVLVRVLDTLFTDGVTVQWLAEAAKLVKI